MQSRQSFVRFLTSVLWELACLHCARVPQLYKYKHG